MAILVLVDLFVWVLHGHKALAAVFQMVFSCWLSMIDASCQLYWFCKGFDGILYAKTWSTLSNLPNIVADDGIPFRDSRWFQVDCLYGCLALGYSPQPNVCSLLHLTSDLGCSAINRSSLTFQ